MAESKAPLDLDALAGHTPGPWAPDYDSEQDTFPLGVGPFCLIDHEDRGKGLPTTAADLRLLAAAPALLALCKAERAYGGKG